MKNDLYLAKDWMESMRLQSSERLYLNKNAACHVDDDSNKKDAHGREKKPTPESESVVPGNVHFDHFL